MESQLPQPQTFGTDAEESYLHPRRPLPIGHLLHKRYRITGVLSDNGGFSMTYRAVDTYRDLNLDVVVKENFPLNVAARHPETLQLHPLRGMEKHFTKTLQRFEEEAELLATLNHPNIVRVSAHFSELNTAYYVMPHIGGIELYRALPPADELSEAELKPVLRSLLEALQYIHDFKLLHRDIKPNNVLLDTKSTPILIDFGLVRSTDTFRTLTRNYTPGYAPVEQISGSGKSGPWTDMYSLGATCYALITGSAPPDSLARLEDDEYSPLLSQPELLNRYSTSLLAGIDRALQMKRTNRWQSAQEWLDALNAATGTFPGTQLPTIHQPQIFTPTQEIVPPHISARQLLQAKNITPDDYNAKLLKCAWSGNTELVRLLITAGADVNATGEGGDTPLYWAAQMGHTECLRLLLAAPGINANKGDLGGETPLYWAAYWGYTECVRHLLAAPGINVNVACMYSGETPLFGAAVHGHTECVRLLLETPGIDVNKAEKDGETPLYGATLRGHTECVRLLLETPGIDVNKANKYGWTPLRRAAADGNTECVKLLLAAPGIDVNKADNDGWTPLKVAASWGHSECVRLLLAAPGIDVNKADEDGSTPLYWAAWNGHTECVKLLLAFPGIDVNKASNSGSTPLYWAAWKGHSECVKLLLAVPGIDVNKADNSGETPLKAAESKGHTECARLIREAGGKE